MSRWCAWTRAPITGWRSWPALPVWYAPADEDAEVALDMAWQQLTGQLAGEPRDIALQGRVLRVPQAAMGVARFSFAQLCEQPLGANDYLRFAQEFHTLIVDNIPVMDCRNATRPSGSSS